jgi:hypothetical protein
MPNLDKIYLEDTTNTRFKLFFDEINFGRLDFLDSFYTRLQQLKKQGLDNDAIAQELWNEIIKNKKLQSLENQETAHLWDFMKGTSQYTVWSSLDDNTLYKWVWTPGVEHCEGCKSRNGKIKTLAEWEKEGLPGSGNTQCHDNCLCDLEEVKNPNQQHADKEPTPTPVPAPEVQAERAIENFENDFKQMLKQELDNIKLDRSSAEVKEIKNEMEDLFNLHDYYRSIGYSGNQHVTIDSIRELTDKWDMQGLDLAKLGNLADPSPEGTDLVKQFRNLIIYKYSTRNYMRHESRTLKELFEHDSDVWTFLTEKNSEVWEAAFNVKGDFDKQKHDLLFDTFTGELHFDPAPSNPEQLKKFHEFEKNRKNKDIQANLYLGSFTYEDTKLYDGIEKLINNKRNKTTNNKIIKGKRTYGQKKQHHTAIA